MKKFLVFILTVAYMASTSGATIYIHQCMGKTIAWDILENEGNSCSKCGMHKNAPKDCCKDHVKVLKIHNDQNLPEVSSVKVFLSVAALPPFFYSTSQYYFPQKINNSGESYTPLRSNKPNYCILHCVFLI